MNILFNVIQVTNLIICLKCPGYEPISSTLWRQREEYCARMIQTAWRRQFTMGEDEESEEDDIKKFRKKSGTSAYVSLDEDRKEQIRKNIKENLKRRDKETLKRRVSYPRGWPSEPGQAEDEKAQEAANVLAAFVSDPIPKKS